MFLFSLWVCFLCLARSGKQSNGSTKDIDSDFFFAVERRNSSKVGHLQNHSISNQLNNSPILTVVDTITISWKLLGREKENSCSWCWWCVWCVRPAATRSHFIFSKVSNVTAIFKKNYLCTSGSARRTTLHLPQTVIASSNYPINIQFFQQQFCIWTSSQWMRCQ